MANSNVDTSPHPLDRLLDDDTISTIMVEGYGKIYFRRDGKLEESIQVFDDAEHLQNFINSIFPKHMLDDDSPIVEVFLRDYIQVQMVRPPVAPNGPVLSIRKLTPKQPLTIQELIDYGSMSGEIADFVRACVISKINIVVAGGINSGKTTFLNMLANFIPQDKHIMIIGQQNMLQMERTYVTRLFPQPGNTKGTGAITMSELVMRINPDRLIIPELRGGETLDFLQAINTGYGGSMAALHSNTPRDAISQMEVMCLMGGIELPLGVIREQIAAALDLIVSTQRLRDGSRKIMSITEVRGTEEDAIIASDIFEFKQTGTEDGKIIGSFQPTGIRPRFIPQIEDSGIVLPPSIFETRKRH
jgi:pilus assembly protein CpaF